MSLFVVEGPDGSGKSTFIANLMHLLPDGSRTLHRGPLKRDPMLEYVGDLLSYVPSTGMDVTCDRWHLGEMVYGPLYRGESRLTPAMNLFVEMFLSSRGAVRLWMDTPYDIVRSRLAARGEDFLLEQHQRLVVDWYSEALSIYPEWIPVPWQYKPSFLDQMVTTGTIMQLRAASVMERWPSYVGPLDEAQVLIIGSQAAPLQAKNWCTSLIPWRNSPVHAILTAMTHLNVVKVGMLEKTHRAAELYEKLGRPTVFTLGHESWQYCAERDIPSRRLALPSHSIPITQLVHTLQERMK